MALVLVPTVSAANANAYLDLTAAQAIIDATPNADDWGDDSDAQTKAVVSATSMLEALAYQGVKALVSQALAWPRASVRDPDYGQDVQNVGFKLSGGDWGVWLDYTLIPRRIQRACTMLALEIMRAGTSDVWGVDDDINKASKTVDVLRTDFVAPGLRRTGLRVYPSVWREVYPLTLGAQGATVERA